MYGRIAHVASRYAGTSAVGTEVAGQTVISVDSTRDFTSTYGFVMIGGSPVAYNSVDIVNKTITLATALTSTLQQGSDIRIFPLSVQRWALVESEGTDTPTDAIWAQVPHALAGFLAEDGRRADGDKEVVTYERFENYMVITDIKDRTANLNPDAIPDASITETKITPGSITTPLLAANAVATGNLQANSVDSTVLRGDAINGKTIVGAIIKTAATGKRLELTSSGLVQLDSAGNVILSIGDTNKFTGSVDAVDIIIRDSLQLFGKNNLFATGSKVTLKSSVSAPTQAPVMSWVYDSGPAVSQNGWFVFGVHTVNGSNLSTIERWYGESKFKTQWGQWTFPYIGNPVDKNSEYKANSYIRIRNAANTADRAVMIGDDENHLTPNGYPEEWVRIYDDSTIVSAGNVAPVLKVAFKFDNFSYFKTNRLIRVVDGGLGRSKFGILQTSQQADGTRALKMYLYSYDASDSSVTVTSVSDFGVVFPAGEDIAGGAYGSSVTLGLDGASRTVILIQTNVSNYVYDVSIGFEPASQFPLVFNAQDLTWVDGDITANTVGGLYSYNKAAGGDVKSYKYANNHKTSDSTIWSAFVWRGEAATSFRTTMSAQSSTPHRKMAKLRVTMPALPAPIAGVGAARDPAKDVYGWVYFLGVGSTAPARTAMYEQAVQPTMVSNTALADTSIDLSTYPVLSGTNPPASPTFPASSPASIESDNGSLSIDGDGAAKVASLLIGSKSVLIASGSASVAPTTFVDITFPVGRFATAPSVVTQCAASANVALVANVLNVTASGFRAYFYGVGGSWTSGNTTLYWQAQSIG